jgi:hypothetical protein
VAVLLPGAIEACGQAAMGGRLRLPPNDVNTLNAARPAPQQPFPPRTERHRLFRRGGWSGVADAA